MAQLRWKRLVGQERIKEVLGAAFRAQTLGHAYLLCGDEGVGTFQGALELAMALLCEHGETVPCYECSGCRKAIHHAHPDLNIMFPVALAKEHRSSDGSLSQKGWQYVSEQARWKVEHPYMPAVVEGVPTIPVEWIREVNHAILRGALNGPRSVAIFSGVEYMRAESANAMLKTLEEPPEGSILLLCTAAPQDVLPTIHSRCQVLRFGHLSDDDVRDGLARIAGGEHSDDDVRFAVECAQGNLGTALQLLAEPQPDAMRTACELWDLAGQRDLLSTAKALDSLVGNLAVGSAEDILIYCMHIIRNSMVAASGQGERFVPAGTPLLADGVGRFEPARADKLLAHCGQAIRSVRARGNLALIFTNFLFDVREILHGQEQ